jgi:hypothetical protein
MNGALKTDLSQLRHPTAFKTELIHSHSFTIQDRAKHPRLCYRLSPLPILPLRVFKTGLTHSRLLYHHLCTSAYPPFKGIKDQANPVTSPLPITFVPLPMSLLSSLITSLYIDTFVLQELALFCIQIICK